MISNYYTLAAIVRTIGDTYSGWRVDTPFTQRRNELVIPLSSPDDEPSASIIASCEPSANFLVVRTQTSRASRNSADIFPVVSGRLVRSCTMHPSDRIVALSLEGDYILLFRFFGSRANVSCLGPDGMPLESFLRARSSADAAGFPFPPPGPPELATVLDRSRQENPETPVEQAVRKAYPTLGPLLVRELLFRSSIDPAASVTSLSDTITRALIRSFGLFMEELLDRPSPRVVVKNDEPVHFSLVSLHHLGQTVDDSQPSISRGILRFLSSQKRQDSFLSQKKQVQHALETDLERSIAARDAVGRSILPAPEIDLLERYGKILHMHLSDVSKGMTSLEASDPFEQTGVLRTIALDPSLSPAKNAERYFDRAKNARARLEDSRRRLRDVDEHIRKIGELQDALEALSDTDGLRVFTQQHKAELPLLASPASGGRSAPAVPPFRVYTVEGGFEVWVGKNSANNDLLTTRHTAKNDLWFHARGVGGSHVVLKAGTGKGEISKRAKEQAAAIAAHYSKMKNARHVAVSMCFGKFVRKPRKAPLGTVTIEREEVLFVDPAIPKET